MEPQFALGFLTSRCADAGAEVEVAVARFDRLGAFGGRSAPRVQTADQHEANRSDD